MLAVLEYVADLHPNAPARTGPMGLSARIGSGAFCGGALMAAAGHPVVPGVFIGGVCAAIGSYGGLALRLRTMRSIGPIPAAFVEDGVAIAASAAVVIWL